MRTGFLVVVACGVALAMTACGGGGDSSLAASSMTKSEYIQKASEVCERNTKELEINYGTFLKEGRFGNHPQESNYVDFLNTVVKPGIEKEIEELRALGAPKGEEKEVEAILAAREESIRIAEEDPEAVIEDSAKVFSKASKVAEEYGLNACATR